MRRMRQEKVSTTIPRTFASEGNKEIRQELVGEERSWEGFWSGNISNSFYILKDVKKSILILALGK